MVATRGHAGLNRATRGRLFRRWFGAPVLVLETVGRRSGKPRSTPVVYLRDGDAFVVMAAAAGVRTPAWWLNLEASGEGTIVVGGRRAPVRPRIPTGHERDRLWERYVSVYPPAAEYPKLGSCHMPLIVLEPG